MSDILANMTNDGYDIILKDGDINLCSSEVESIEQEGYIAIFTRRGDNIFHEDLGNELWNTREKIAESNIDAIEQYCRDAVISSNELINDIETLDIYINHDYPNSIAPVLHIGESNIDIEDDLDDEDEEEGVDEDGITE